MKSTQNSQNKYSIIIPAAGLGVRMKSIGPKSLIKLKNGETVFDRQIRIINSYFPNNEIICVGGFGFDKVYKHINGKYNNIKLINNHKYEINNVVGSINLGMQHITTDHIIIVYGDLVFNETIFEGVIFENEPAVLVDSKNGMKDEEIGCVTNDGYLDNMLWKIPNKWAQVLFLTGQSLNIVKNTIKNPRTHKMYMFEIINMLLDRNINIRAIAPHNLKITDIDTINDLNIAMRIK